MNIDISTLPTTVQRKIPLSIRTYKSVYNFDELPNRVQDMIKQYLESLPTITYKTVFDFKPSISKYSDFEVIDNKINLVTEYLKNYLLILPESYPFDPIFGCTLKYHLQTRDTSLRQTLVSAETDRIVDILTLQLDIPVVVKKIKMNKISTGGYDEINTIIDVEINNYYKSITLSFI